MTLVDFSPASILDLTCVLITKAACKFGLQIYASDFYDAYYYAERFLCLRFVERVLATSAFGARVLIPRMTLSGPC